MIKRKSFKYIMLALLFAFCTLICTTCYNPLMEAWWPEDRGGKGGVNFAVVILDLNGGEQSKYEDGNTITAGELGPFRVLYGDKVPRVRPVSHTDKTNWGFGGWVDEYGNPWDLDTRTVKKDDDADNSGFITLKAKWVKKFVTVKFHMNYEDLFPNYDTPLASWTADMNFKYPKTQAGGKIEVPDQQVAAGGKIVEPPVLPTDGFHGLIGWFLVNHNPVTDQTQLNNLLNSGTKWDFDNKTVGSSGTMDLYAVWGSSYVRTVHLQVNGGTRPNGQELTRVNFTVFTGLAGSPGGKIIDPGPLTREGYTFTGWYTDSGVEWNFSTSKIYEVDILGGDNNDILLNDYFNLHARWVPNIYYVNFNAAGGTPVPPRQEVQHGNRVTPPPPMNPPVIEGKEQAFAGWWSEAGKKWDFDKDVVKDTMTLTAHWEPMTYTVTFHLGSPPDTFPPTVTGLHKVYTDAQPKVQYIQAGGKAIEPFMPALPADAVKTNWSFVRWDYYDGTGDDPEKVNDTIWREDGNLKEWDFETDPVNKNINLYARWVEAAPDMIWVPPGSFVMGDSGVSGSPAEYHSYPTRRVTLDGFYISRYEITSKTGADTNPSYTTVMGNNPSQFYLDEVRPVERVSWYDAITYCNKLTEQTTGMTSADHVYTITSPVPDSNYLAGTLNRPPSPSYPIINATTVTANFSKRGYRLPTEAEWEYAARGGHNSPGNYTYSGSNDATKVAWFNTTVSTQGAGAAQRVGRLDANSLGIFDMSGNISEWVWDKFVSYKDPYYATNAGLHNPRGPSGSNGNAGPANGDEQRVRRGGQWNNAASNVRSVVRNSEAAKTANWVIGFRVVRGPSAIW